MNLISGISSGFHDASISLINSDGEILYALHSERYSGVKNDKNLNNKLMGYIKGTVAATAQGTLGLVNSITTRALASAYIVKIDTAISIVSSRRGSFGAVSNRLDSTITSLSNMKANIELAKGQIVDTDYATETANLARAQILLQAATAMLAQANAAKNNTLQLING